MARKALYKHATQVDTTAYPDDGSLYNALRAPNAIGSSALFS